MLETDVWLGMLRRGLDEPRGTRGIAGAVGVRSNASFAWDGPFSPTASHGQSQASRTFEPLADPDARRPPAPAHVPAPAPASAASAIELPRGLEPPPRPPVPGMAELLARGGRPAARRAAAKPQKSDTPTVSNPMEILRLRLRDGGKKWKPPV